MPREMNPHDWVALAASRDKARPVLCYLHVTETLCEATDSYRLHRTAANGRLPGLWDVKSGASVPGSYPDTARVTKWTAPSTHRVLDTDEFRAVAAAAVAFNQGAPEPVTSRPGARFYVTIADGNMRRSGFLLGPYASHLVALANVPRARRLAEQRDSMAWHYAYGTASMPSSRNTVFGR